MERRRNTHKLLLPIIIYFTAELGARELCVVRGSQHGPAWGGRQRSYPHCEDEGVRNGDLGDISQDEAKNLWQRWSSLRSPGAAVPYLKDHLSSY